MIMGKLQLEENPLTEILKNEEYLIVLEGTNEFFYTLDEVKADYIAGQIFIQMTASRKHEQIFMKLATTLNGLVEKNNLGEVYGSRFPVAIEPEYHPEPDIFFVSKNNPGKFKETCFEGIPDLIIEILSKSTRKHDLETKRTLYQKHLIPEIWFIDYLNKKIIVDYLKNSSYESLEWQTQGKAESRMIESFAINLETIFKD